MSTIPVAFLSQAASILASTEHGMSGSKIVEFCNAWAADHGVDTPHATYPFDAKNKRTALLENLRTFAPHIQYQMLLDLCDLAGSDRSEVQGLRGMLLSRFQPLFGGSHLEDPSADASVLRLLGIEGAASYSNAKSDPPSRALSVFICHASEDKAAARRLHKQLKSDGFAPWLDEEDLVPGQDWATEIPKAVRRSDVVLVCLSTRSVAKTGYVQREIRIALDAAEERPDGTVYIIPARLEECQVPERLTKWHWVDTFSENGYERLCRALNQPPQRAK